MTTREKIIVGVMCLTIVYGAYDLLGPRNPGRKAPPPQANPVDELKKFVMEITRKLAGEKLAAEYRHMMAQAGAQWTKDPFLHSAAELKKSLGEHAAVRKPVTVRRAPALTYTGFMQLGDSKLAILNGTEYARGESLNVENYYVKEIHPTRVVIGKTNGLETIQLPLAEIESGIDK